MRDNFFNSFPKLSLFLVNLVLILFIFFATECILRIYTPYWLENRMTLLNPKNKQHSNVKYSDQPLKKIILSTDKNKFLSYIPNSRTKLRHIEYENTINIDKYGGRKTSSDNRIFSDSLRKVIFLGDSFTFGVGVEDDEVFCSLLQKDLNVKVLNLGRPGSSLPRDINLLKLMLPQFIKKNKIHDIVMCWFLGNDAADIIKYSSAQSKQKIKKEIKISTKQNSDDLMFRINSFIYYNQFFNKSYFLQYLRKKVIDLTKYSNIMDPVFYLFQNEESYVNNFQDLTRNYLEELSELSMLYDLRITFLLIPDRSQIYDIKRKALKEQYNISESTQLDYLMPNKLIIPILEEYQFDYMDPTICLKNQAQDRDDLYYNNDNHLTNIGHRLYYECIKDELSIKLN
ncbi:MAG: hypothetical protein HN522_00405 [Flavobacteriales bacterium]|nr:hypothetical protein [Flavobacteriales bacterium]